MKESLEKRAATGLALLEELEGLLIAQNERNYIRGIRAVIAELRQPDGSVDVAGFENARSSYLHMTSGGRRFAEYCVWDDDYDTRRLANSRLDQIRHQLWWLFSSED